MSTLVPYCDECEKPIPDFKGGSSDRELLCEECQNTRSNEAMRGWQPIETAPHAEDVLLFIPATEFTPASFEAGFASGGRRVGRYSSQWKHGHATHWMPLPEPPK